MRKKRFSKSKIATIVKRNQDPKGTSLWNKKYLENYFLKYNCDIKYLSPSYKENPNAETTFDMLITINNN